MLRAWLKSHSPVNRHLFQSRHDPRTAAFCAGELCWLEGAADAHAYDRVPCLYLAQSAAPRTYLVLYMHGNAETLQDCCAYLRRLRDALHMPVLAVEYPSTGVSRPHCCAARACGRAHCGNERDAIAFAYRAYRHARDALRYEPHEILLLGRSIGGGVACALAARMEHPPAALLLHGTFQSIKRVAAEHIGAWTRLFLLQRFDNGAALARRPCVCDAVLLMHARRDEAIPLAHAHALYAQCTAPCKALAVLERGSHNRFAVRDIAGTILYFLQQRNAHGARAPT